MRLHGVRWKVSIKFQSGSAMQNLAYGRTGGLSVWKARVTGWPGRCTRKGRRHGNTTASTMVISQKWDSKTFCRSSRLSTGILILSLLTTRVWEHSISLLLATITTTLTFGTRNTSRGTPRTLDRTRTSLTDGRRRQLTALCASPQ